MEKLAAEIFGTFALVFAGTGTIVINDVSGGTVTHVGVALTVGLVVMAMIYALGDVSGAHLNHAVTVGFYMARRLAGGLVAPYVLSQCLGALYVLAPVLGAGFAVLGCRCVNEKGCCAGAKEEAAC